MSAVVTTNGGVKGGTPWPDTSAPGVFPRGEPDASILVNAEFVREMLRAAQDATAPAGNPPAVWLSIYTLELEADATHKKPRREGRLVIQTHRTREKGATFASVLMPMTPVNDGPRPAMPYSNAPAATEPA